MDGPGKPDIVRTLSPQSHNPSQALAHCAPKLYVNSASQLAAQEFGGCLQHQCLENSKCWDTFHLKLDRPHGGREYTGEVGTPLSDAELETDES